MANDKWDKKVKSPKDPVSDMKIEPKQGWWYGSADPLGGHSFVYVNPNKKEEYFQQTLSAHGSFSAHSYDDDEKGFHVGLNVGGVRKYNTKSVSHQTDGQHQSDVEKCVFNQSGGDKGSATVGDTYSGRSGNHIHGMGGNQLNFLQGGSDVKNYRVVNGDVGNKYEGHVHTSYKKDEVKAFKEGNKLTMIEKGDFAVNVQKGNWDTDVASKVRLRSGKAMLYTTDDTWDAQSAKSMALQTDTSLRTKSKQGTTFEAGEDFMISSDSKITLKVGGSSIEITDGSIKINSSGPVDIKGSQTKIQGGGVTTWQLAGTPLRPSTWT
jgi:hypothetical protein